MSVVECPPASTLSSELSGKIAVVTGGASGIGFAIAQLFTSSGATVVVIDIDASKAEAAAQQLGTSARFHACDISSWSDQVRMFAWVKENVGTVDIFCLNAGINPELVVAYSAEHSTSPPAATKVLHNYLASEKASDDSLVEPPTPAIDVNLKGTLYGLKLSIHHMLSAARPGRIIITGSAGSYFGMGYQDIYVASKHALLGLMRSTASRPDIANSSISVSLIAPWLTKTPMSEKMDPAIKASTVQGEAEDVALAAAYLATSERSKTHGKCLMIHGRTLIETEDSHQKWLSGLTPG